jgi:hypothetical protein
MRLHVVINKNDTSKGLVIFISQMNKTSYDRREALAPTLLNFYQTRRANHRNRQLALY